MRLSANALQPFSQSQTEQPQVGVNALLQNLIPGSHRVRELTPEEIVSQDGSLLSLLPKELLLFLILQSGLNCHSAITFTSCCKKFLQLRADPQVKAFFTAHFMKFLAHNAQKIPHGDIKPPHAFPFQYQQAATRNLTDFGFSYTF